MQYSVQFQGKTWYLFTRKVTFKNGQTFRIHWFSHKGKPKNWHCRACDKLPNHLEVYYTWMPLIRRKVKDGGASGPGDVEKI